MTKLQNHMFRQTQQLTSKNRPALGKTHIKKSVFLVVGPLRGRTNKSLLIYRVDQFFFIEKVKILK